MTDALSDIYRKVQPTLRIGLLAGFFTILFFISQPALAAVGPTGTYSDWNFPGSVTTTDYKNFSWDVTVNVDPSPQSYFYSTQFWFIQDDKSIDPNGGYFGIQTNGSAPTGKIAIFSIWGAVDASGPEYAQPFGAEGTGYSVRITYPWVQGRTYHLRIGPISADGQWWGAWIKDTVTGMENFVGQIKLSVPRLLLYNPPLSWTEYYGPPFSTCGGYNLSDVSFTNVAANDGAIKPNRYNNHLASPVNCPGSYIVNITDGTRQQMAASSDTLPPSVPTGLTATAISSSQINLSWSASTDNVAVTSYKIYRNGSQIGTSASTNYSDTGLSASTNYTYTVSAYDAANNEFTQSSSASTITQSLPATSPVISTFTATPSSITTGQSSTLSWSVTGTPAPTVSIDQNIGTVTGLSKSVTPAQTTTYSLTASNSAGSVSKTVTVTVSVTPDISAPTVPANLESQSISSSQVNLSWTASTDNVGVAGYKLFRNGSQIATITSGTSYTDTNLTPSTSYSYTISTFDATGNQSAQSSAKTVTTLAASITNTAPVISSFTVYPTAITAGQSAILSWSVTGSPAPILSINQNIGTVTGSSQSISPTLTTTYTLTASSSVGTDSKSVTVTVTVPTTTVSTTTNPSVSNPPPASPALTSTYSTRLINDNGTFYLVQNNQREGITNPGMLYSYGFEFKDALPATAADLSFPVGSLLLPGNGALVKSQEDPTVYLISRGQRHGFTSADVFLGLGFMWNSVLTVTNPELQTLPIGTILSDPSSSHWDGLDINVNGTIYWINNQIRHPYPSLSVYNSWHKDGDFSKVVPANDADLYLQIGDMVTERIIQ